VNVKCGSPRLAIPVVVPLLMAAALAGCRSAEPTAGAAPLNQDRYRRPDLLVAALHFGPGGVVADVGAGDGYLTHRLAARAGVTGRVVATDVDAAALARIGAGATGEAPIVTRVVAPDDPGLEPASYDLIVLSQVDHLLADRVAYLRKLTPCLRAGGRIALSNRRPYRAAALDAARRAGLREVASFDGLPANFLVEVAP
jgi:SAM-dependent methyltransferase